MEEIQIKKVLFSRTIKGRILGVFQVAICPTLIIITFLYIDRNAISPDAFRSVVIALAIFCPVFGMLGYSAGPLFLSQKTLQEFSDNHPERIRAYVEEVIAKIKETITEKERAIDALKEMYL